MAKNKRINMNSRTISKSNTNIVYSNKDLFSVITDRVSAGNNGCTVFVPHVCNNIDLFGAGFAAQVAKNYPSVKTDYHLLGKSFLKNNLGYSQILKVYEDPKFRHKLYFVNMVSQNGVRSANNPRPLHYGALVKSMSQLTQYIYNNTGFAHKTEKIEIHSPKFGSGLAGGNWDFIQDIIDDIWGRFFVTVYNYKQK